MSESTEPELNPQFVLGLYKQCWDNFYQWEPGYCQLELQKLSPSVRSSGPQASLWDDLDDWETKSEAEDVAKDAEAFSSIIVQNESPLQIAKLRAPLVTLKLDFAPLPPYEYCRRIHHYLPSYEEKEMHIENALDGEDSQLLWLTFCPLVDEDERLPEHHLRTFLEDSIIGWETQSVHDNDIDIIEIEVVARLLGMELKPEQVDELFLLPRCILGTDDPGIVTVWNRREHIFPPHWTIAHPLIMGNENKLHRLVDHFHAWCSLCAEYECHFHPFSPAVTQKAITRTTKLPNMIGLPETACHQTDCVVSHSSTETFQDAEDVRNMITTFFVTYSVLKWTTSCEIAAILAEPCWKVHKIINEVLESSKSTATIDKVHSSRPGSRIQPPNFLNWKPVGPCYHEGPCTQTECPCVEIGNWCSSMCQCSLNCPRRPVGCKCKGKCDIIDQCVCRREDRECDPDICLTCRPLAVKTVCVNNNIQRRRNARTEIRRAEHGWGLFALENIPRFGWIAPYLGELHSSCTANVREIVARHCGRNYNFTMTSEMHIDGTSCGNETRFINDPRRAERVNCVIRRIWVDGHLYFGIEASKRIKRGHELYLSYGNDFWS